MEGESQALLLNVAIVSNRLLSPVLKAKTVPDRKYFGGRIDSHTFTCAMVCVLNPVTCQL